MSLPNNPLQQMKFFEDLNAADYWNKISNGRIQARYVSPFAVILWQKGVGYPEIREGTFIGHFCIIDGTFGLKIGINCDIACGVHIYTHTTAKRATMGIAKEGAPVKIGDHVFIGPNSVVSLGCTIEDRVVVPPLTYVEPFTTLQKGERLLHG